MKEKIRIAFLLSTTLYSRAIFHGIKSYINIHKAPWQVQSGPSDPRTVQAAQKWGAHGFIAYLDNREVEDALVQHGAHAVNYSGILASPRIPRVRTDDRLAGKQAAEFFLAKGFRHFAFSGYSNYHYSMERQIAFEQTVREAGWPCHILEHEIPDTDLWNPYMWKEREERIGKWLEALPKPLAFYCAEDLRAIQIAEVASERTIPVPESVAILGTDNLEMLCDFASPSLSSLAPNMEKVGFEAAALLGRLINGERNPPNEILVAPLGIKARRSTDLEAVEDTEVAAAAQFIRENAGRPILVEDILKAVPMSRRNLERRFKSVLGRSPLEEIHRLRIQKAKELLTIRGLTIKEVAQRCGFSSAKGFALGFARLAGMTPSQYRKENLLPLHE